MSKKVLVIPFEDVMDTYAPVLTINKILIDNGFTKEKPIDRREDFFDKKFIFTQEV